MTYVLRSFKQDDVLYHEIWINTMCCKRKFLVIEEADGRFFDVEKGEYCLEGTVRSIKQHLKMKELM
jgi:hypothetical protein